MLFHYVRVKSGLRNLDREIFQLKIRHEPAGQPRLTRIELKCYWMLCGPHQAV